MLNQNVEIVLDDGNVVYIDFTVCDVGRFSQDVTIVAVRNDNQETLHIEDLDHVMINICDRIDEYLKSTNQQTKFSYKGIF